MRSFNKWEVLKEILLRDIERNTKISQQEIRPPFAKDYIVYARWVLGQMEIIEERLNKNNKGENKC